MPLNERHVKILELLNERNQASVKFLSEKLYVCEMTVRRDLSALEKDGYLRRYHGGAVIINDYTDCPIEIRLRENEQVKKELAKVAKEYIRDNMTIYLDSSATCSYILSYIKEYSNITVITNSIMYLSQKNIKFKSTGGDYYPADQCLIGRETENYLRQINPDVAFLSCDAISSDGILTDASIEWASIAKIVLKNSFYSIFLIDNTKTNKRYRHNICHIDDADKVIII